MCLNSGHRSNECTEKPCDLCSRNHHHTLHRSTQQINASPVSRENNETNSEIISRSFLPVLRIQVRSQEINGECTAVLDSGSEINIISSRLSQQLKLAGEPFQLQIVGAGGDVRTVKTKRVMIHATDNNGKNHEIRCVVLSKTCGRALKFNNELISESSLSKLRNKNIYTEGGEVDLLIGMSNPEIHKQISMETLENRLIIMETCFGHCLVGAKPTKKISYQCGKNVVNSLCMITDDHDEHIMKSHLDIEEEYADAPDADVPGADEEEHAEDEVEYADAPDADEEHEDDEAVAEETVVAPNEDTAVEKVPEEDAVLYHVLHSVLHRQRTICIT